MQFRSGPFAALCLAKLLHSAMQAWHVSFYEDGMAPQRL